MERPRPRGFLKRIGDPATAFQWWVLSSAPLLFPVGPAWLLPVWVAIALVPLGAAIVTRQPSWPRSPSSLPVLILLACVTLGYVVSPVPQVSTPKFTGVLAGVLAWRAVSLSVSSGERLVTATRWYLRTGVVVVLFGVLGANVSSKFLPSSVTDLFRQRLGRVPGTSTEGAVNANALGGTTLFFLPLAAAVVLGPGRGRPGDGDEGARSSPYRGMGEAAGTVAVMLAVLALSQSRSAWFAASLALAIVAVLRFRTLRLLAVAAVAIGVCAWPGELSATVGRMLTSPGSFTMEARLELWSRALFATGHFPATGMGLNAFREVAPALYPLIIIQTQRDLAHSHNTFLQVALDAGLIGLIAYVALLLLAWTLGGWVARRTAGPASVVAVGACGNLLAIHLFGLTDAIALGAKVGLFLWITLGLIEALWAQHGARLALATADVGRSARSLQTS